MAKMLGKGAGEEWCSYCHGPAGPDCPSKAREKKATRQAEERAWRGEEEQW